MAIREGATNEWSKSSYSTGNGACVEVRSPALREVAVRDSKVHEGPSLAFGPETWTAFVGQVSRGAFDLG
ncbi:DUF397 domain-containing protein [Streptomyces sp. TRM66268-LWL]|uniref:DUF397 domain-containing protein n=1 Tax=Streptomyces polyasparticus TaxID=2767826 RepID=A0ABR7SXL1_9ACTN|nr:DUF397 domain-containing protein [Streptomyces polyasparticus]MBC9719003.1 DUF397 domain-containing protein [Streptomyces polyasparticus]